MTHLTRRKSLITGASLAVGMSGCLSSNNDTEPTPSEPQPTIERLEFAEPEVVDHSSTQINENPDTREYSVTVLNNGDKREARIVLYEIEDVPQESFNGEKNSGDAAGDPVKIPKEKVSIVKSVTRTIPRNATTTARFTLSGAGTIKQYRFTVHPKEFSVDITNYGSEANVRALLLANSETVIDEETALIPEGDKHTVELTNTSAFRETDFKVQVEPVNE